MTGAEQSSAPLSPAGTARAADVDREAIAEKLRVAAVEGRIDFEELDDRLGQAYSAKTYGQLRALVADLPVQPASMPQRTLLIDRRTGTTTPGLWPPDAQPHTRDTRDIDDWLALIAAGGGVGITPEGTTNQYRRDGVMFRPLRDAPPITVRMIWRQHDPHPSTHAAIALLTDLYRGPAERPADRGVSAPA